MLGRCWVVISIHLSPANSKGQKIKIIIKLINGIVALFVMALGIPISYTCAKHNIGEIYAIVYLIAIVIFIITSFAAAIVNDK